MVLIIFMFPGTGCLSPSENEAIDLQEDEIRAVETSGTNSTETAETKKKNDNAKQVKFKWKLLVIEYTISSCVPRKRRRALRIVENPDAWVAGESSLVQFLVGGFPG